MVGEVFAVLWEYIVLYLRYHASSPYFYSITRKKKCAFSKQELLIFLTSSENEPTVAFSTKISHKYLSVNHLGQYCLSHVGISAIKSKAPIIEH